MRKAIALMLTLALLCVPLGAAQADVYIPTQADMPVFTGLNDPKLLPWLEDSVYAGLNEQFGSEDYLVEDVRAIYYSKEYLEETEYNSRSNIFFGSTLEELDAQFEGQSYVFTLSDDGKTIVTTFEDYDDTYDKLVGAVGVVLVAVTVVVAKTLPFLAVIAVPASIVLNNVDTIGSVVTLTKDAVDYVQTGELAEEARDEAIEASGALVLHAVAGLLQKRAGT